jgi:diguanylate cyclase (GGDEF)-like protein
MLRVLVYDTLKRRIQKKTWTIAPVTAIIATLIGYTGILQTADWAMLDCFFQWRPGATGDPRILVVTISDEDINQLGDWPISDQILADALTKLSLHQPRMIGLDLYRDLPVEPGHQALAQLLQSTPNLLVISKNFGTRQVPAPENIPPEQIAFADLVEDQDGTVRRALLTARSERDGIQLSLALNMALGYLAAEEIFPEPLDEAETIIRLGHTVVRPLRPNSGGYVRADVDGYQILLNYTGDWEHFQSLSILDVLAGRIPEDMVRDRLVFIGSVAESTNDFFRTPFDSSDQGRFAGTAGVYIHANISSQILSAALDGRSLLRVVPESLEFLWTLGWTLLLFAVSGKVLNLDRIGNNLALAGAIGSLLGGGLVLTGSSYVLLLQGWWLPIMVPLLGMAGAIIANLLLHSQRLRRLAYMDGLTQVANRRYFDQRFASYSYRRGHLSLILCDVDCFKAYNDTYGHQAGDRCLQQVAAALRRSVRRTDLVARYGGEEFAIILPRSNQEVAIHVAQRILEQIRQMQIPHQSSTVADHVTLSCGVVSLNIDDTVLQRVDWSSSAIIAEADEALYQSKRAGRDRFTVAG